MTLVKGTGYFFHNLKYGTQGFYCGTSGWAKTYFIDDNMFGYMIHYNVKKFYI